MCLIKKQQGANYDIKKGKMQLFFSCGGLRPLVRNVIQNLYKGQYRWGKDISSQQQSLHKPDGCCDRKELLY